MTLEYRHHIEEVRATFKRVCHDERLVGGARLWGQFEDAAAAFERHGPRTAAAIYERVNELALAEHLIADPTLASAPIVYEPETVPGGPRFDFHGAADDGAPVLVELKSVVPRTEDNDASWSKAERRLERVTPGTHVVVGKGWMGGAIAGNMFNARAAFLDYTRETEAKLVAHASLTGARAILVFGGDGARWNISELEDFADFYATGRHRSDDPWAAMEAHDMAENGIALQRNITAIGMLKRDTLSVAPGKLVYPVRGPHWDR